MSNFTNAAEWSIRPLIEVATLQRGYDLPVQDRTTGAYPIFAANGPVGFHGIAKCKAPGVVTGRSGTIGKVHYVNNDYWPLNTSLYVTDFHGNHPKWVYYMLQSFGLEQYAQGAGVPTLNRNLIHHELIKVPPIEEQRRIAAILDQAETLRTQRRTALALLDSLTQSLFLDMFGHPATNPKGWSTMPIGETAVKFSDGPFGSNLKSSHYRESGIRVIRLQNIGVGKFFDKDKAFISQEHFDTLRKHECLPGDVLIGTLGEPNLRACIQPTTLKCSLNKADCVQLRPNPKIATAEFLCALLNQPAVETMAQDLMLGQTRVRISMGRLRGLVVPIPPLPLQQTFATRIQSIEALKATHRRALAALDELFASLQQRAFAGQL